MAFLFKSKKNEPKSAGGSSALPPTSRNIHTSDGSSAPNSLDLAKEKASDRSFTSPAPGAGPNGSLNSVASSGNATGPQYVKRDRAESEAGARPGTSVNQHPNAALYPWSQRRLNFPTPQSNPFPRYGAAVNATASKDGDIYMMGGLINGSMVRGDLWMVVSGGGGLSCYPIATVAEGPGPRVGHASLLVGNAFIVFGGDTKIDDSDALDDTLYLLNTSSRQWSRAAPPGPRPAGRYGHTLNILGSKIFVFGGQVEGSFFNDLIAFDLNALQSTENHWEFLIGNTGELDAGPPKVPPARTNHSMITHNDQLFLFGGTNGNHWFNDVWTYDPVTNAWNQQDCIGYIPAPREGHSAALVGDVMYIFGGRNEEGTDLGDLAAFRISSRRWYTFQNMGPSPSPRSGHSMTAYGSKVIILGGEPSSAPRDPTELSMVYVLDTAKIRYPNDAPASAQASKSEQPNSPTRRVSTDRPNAIGARSASREGQSVNPASRSISREGQVGGPVQKPDNAIAPASRLPRAAPGPLGLSGPSGPSGPPPQFQQGPPRMNGVVSPSNVQRENVQRGPRARPTNSQSPPPGPEPVIQPMNETIAPTSSLREALKENVQPSRESSPLSHGKRTPTQQIQSKAKAMDAGEAAPLMSSGVARQRSIRSQRGHGSVDATEEGTINRIGSSKHYSDTPGDTRSLRSIGDEPKSPKLTPHTEAMVKELDSLKRQNAWYAAELSLARKGGYQSGTASSPVLDDRAVNQFSDEEKPLVELLMRMKAELDGMHEKMEQQATQTAKRIAEVEHQRDASMREAAYARAKLAAHGGSQRSTPQPDSMRDSDEIDRSSDMSRRLALALAAQNEHKAKVEALSNELSAERRAREVAEEAAEAGQRRMEELGQGHNPGELEGLRAELHEAQTSTRAEAGQRAEAQEQLRMLQVDHTELETNHQSVSSSLAEHTASLAALEAVIKTSNEKAEHYERLMNDERVSRETLDQKLSQLRAEHEERTSELELAMKRLTESEERADRNAKEAATHREALMAGFARLSIPDAETKRDIPSDERVAALQESAERASELAKANQEAADRAAQKLRSAEERIAGLEAYQDQSSREVLQIRRQLKAAVQEAQTYQAKHEEARGLLENQQREASALAVQHSALKDLLGERGIDLSGTHRSPNLDGSPTSSFGTPDQGKLRELEHQLEASLKDNEETKRIYEAREQDADRAYKEKLEQLENDYQSAVHYVKGTEKMLKKMREELSKYKTQNQQLKVELERSAGDRAVMDGESGWPAEREKMQSDISELRAQMTAQIANLEENLTSVRQDLATARSERDRQTTDHQALSRSAQEMELHLTQLRSDNSKLETRALDAEHKVTLLLDQVGQSVSNYKRQSQMHAGQPSVINGIAHERDMSVSATTDASSEAEFNDKRGSEALDNFANELETLKAQWESTARNYRLSLNQDFDTDRTPTKEVSGGDFHESLANWRKRLDDDERSTSRSSEVGPA